MSTNPTPTTTDRTDRPTTPRLTTGKWADATATDDGGSDRPAAQLQFSPTCERRLYNLVDAENRAMLGPRAEFYSRI